MVSFNFSFFRKPAAINPIQNALTSAIGQWLTDNVASNPEWRNPQYYFMLGSSVEATMWNAVGISLGGSEKELLQNAASLLTENQDPKLKMLVAKKLLSIANIKPNENPKKTIDDAIQWVQTKLAAQDLPSQENKSASFR